jgi:hypothetical protein
MRAFLHVNMGLTNFWKMYSSRLSLRCFPEKKNEIVSSDDRLENCRKQFGFILFMVSIADAGMRIPIARPSSVFALIM